MRMSGKAIRSTHIHRKRKPRGEQPTALIPYTSSTTMPTPPVTTKQVSLRELFVGFLAVGLTGFGGVLPFIRRMLVEQRGWMDEREFTDALSLCQLLPGPNVMNLTVIVGDRYQGWRGSVAACAGLLLAPILIAVALASLYEHFRNIPAIHHALLGVAASAAGLIMAMAVKMARPYRRDTVLLLVSALTFSGIVLLGWPLWAVLAGMLPLGIALAFRKNRR